MEDYGYYKSIVENLEKINATQGKKHRKGRKAYGGRHPAG